MINLQLTKKQAMMVAGILGVTEGLELIEVYRKITENLNQDERIIVDDITNLIYEQNIIANDDDIRINEDYLYEEAMKLNEPQ